jgi:hypothetical protein
VPALSATGRGGEEVGRTRDLVALGRSEFVLGIISAGREPVYALDTEV